jgi:hypothetical protein
MMTSNWWNRTHLLFSKCSICFYDMMTIKRKIDQFQLMVLFSFLALRTHDLFRHLYTCMLVCVCQWTLTITTSGKWLSILMERDSFTKSAFLWLACQITHFDLSSTFLRSVEDASRRSTNIFEWRCGMSSNILQTFF